MGKKVSALVSLLFLKAWTDGSRLVKKVAQKIKLQYNNADVMNVVRELFLLRTQSQESGNSTATVPKLKDSHYYAAKQFQSYHKNITSS